MRFLFLVNAYKNFPNDYGGPLHSVSYLAESLVAIGHDVIVCTTDIFSERKVESTAKYHEEVVNGVRVFTFSPQPALSCLPVARAFKLFKCMPPACFDLLTTLAGQIDIAAIHTNYFPSTSALVQRLNRNRVPVLFHQRGGFGWGQLKVRAYKKVPYLFLYELPYLRKVDGLVALTEDEVVSYRRLGLKKPVKVIPNGIDLSFGNYKIDFVCPSIKAISNGAPTIFFMSRLNKVKGVDVFLEAVPYILESFSRINIIIAGNDEDGFLPKIRALCARYSSGDKRVYYVGYLKGDDKKHVLSISDCFVLPTRSEGFSMAILEALVCGCRVVTTPRANFPEIESFRVGRIYSGSGLELSAAVSKVLFEITTGEKRSDFLKRTKAILATHYSWPNITDSYLHFSQQVINHKRNT